MDEETLKKQVGNKIKQLRQIKSLSRLRVADKLEMSETNYGCIERGEINVSLVHLAQLAEIFDSYINIYGIHIPKLVDSNTNDKNVFNFSGKNNKDFHNWHIDFSENELKKPHFKTRIRKSSVNPTILRKRSQLSKRRKCSIKRNVRMVKTSNKIY
jgi:transcriptional regulator with XRE-family HTH domain